MWELRNNPFFSLFTALKDFVARSVTKDTNPLQSNSVEEDKGETGSEAVLYRLMDAMLVFSSRAWNTVDDYRRYAHSLSANSALSGSFECRLLPP